MVAAPQRLTGARNYMVDVVEPGEMASAVTFCDEEFQQVAREISSPELTGYESFVETHGLKIHRHLIAVSQGWL